MLQNKGDMLGLAEEQQDIIDLLNKQLSKVAPVPNISVALLTWFCVFSLAAE